MAETERLLRIRKKIKNNLPEFKRQESWRYKRLKESWRRPKGIDNKVRQKRKGFIKMPDIGYRSPAKVRGIHPSGKIDVLITTVDEIEKYDPEKHIIRLSAKLGLRKKNIIIEKAEELGFTIINRPMVEKKEPEKWEKLTELETEELTSGEEEKYVEELEKEGSLEGLPEFKLEETKEETEEKQTGKKKKTKKSKKKEDETQ